MIERVEHGYWWIPGESNLPNNEPLFGTLTFSPVSGGKLEMVGYLTEDSTQAGNELVSINIIHGDIGGKFVTLLHCAVIGKSVRVPGFDTTTILAAFIFVGAHFPTNEDIAFSRVSLSYTHLNEWMRRSSFARRGEYDVEYIPFDTIVRRFEDFDLEFAYTYSQSFELALSSTRILIEDSARLSIVPLTKVSWDSLYQLLAIHLPNFLTLATGHPNYPLDIRGTVGSDDRPVDIYYHVSNFDKNPRQVPRIQMMFTFEDVRDGISTYLSNWIQKSDSLQSVTKLYFESVRNTTLDSHTRFLFLAQVLEAYHRDRDPEGGLYKSPKEYEPIEEELLAALAKHDLGDSQRNKLESSIKYGNDYSLPKRIRELLDELIADNERIADTLREVYGKPRDFAYDVALTRNYLAHRPKMVPKNALKGLEHTKKMQFLVRLCLMRDLGFPLNDVQYLQPEFPWR